MFFCLLHNSTFIFWSFSLLVSCFHFLSSAGFVNFDAWWQHWFWQFISVLITAKHKEPTTFIIRNWNMVVFLFLFPFFFFLNFWQLTVFWWALQDPSHLHSCCRELGFLIGLYYAWFGSSSLYQYFHYLWKYYGKTIIPIYRYLKNYINHFLSLKYGSLIIMDMIKYGSKSLITTLLSEMSCISCTFFIWCYPCDRKFLRMGFPLIFLTYLP